MKNFIIVVLIVIVAILVVHKVYSKRDSSYMQTPDNSTDSTATTTGRYMNIESYVRYNISTLSEAKTVLGGTFFVTKIETHSGTGVVEYEDGHNAYTADFTYTVDADGKPSITSFKIRAR